MAKYFLKFLTEQREVVFVRPAEFLSDAVAVETFSVAARSVPVDQIAEIWRDNICLERVSGILRFATFKAKKPN